MATEIKTVATTIPTMSTRVEIMMTSFTTAIYLYVYVCMFTLVAKSLPYVKDARNSDGLDRR